jgi:hypothetical protein
MAKGPPPPRPTYVPAPESEGPSWNYKFGGLPPSEKRQEAAGSLVRFWMEALCAKESLPEDQLESAAWTLEDLARLCRKEARAQKAEKTKSFLTGLIRKISTTGDAP